MKKLVIILMLLVVAIQFIHPARNTDASMTANDITKVTMVPDDVHEILQRACYDCHSNHTTYPWYSKIQPVDWWMTHHINEGKEHLNFSEFGTYDNEKKTNKLLAIGKTVTDGFMPLNSYLWIHKNAVLTDTEKKTLSGWAAVALTRMGK